MSEKRNKYECAVVRETEKNFFRTCTTIDAGEKRRSMTFLCGSFLQFTKQLSSDKRVSECDGKTFEYVLKAFNVPFNFKIHF